MNEKDWEKMPLKGRAIVFYLALLGIAVTIGMFIIILYFVGEKIGIFSILSINELGSLTFGESVIIFIMGMLLCIYLGLIFVWFIFRFILHIKKPNKKKKSPHTSRRKSKLK